MERLPLNSRVFVCDHCHFEIEAVSKPCQRPDCGKLNRIRAAAAEENQLSYITNVDAGRGLIKCGSAIVPFVNSFPKNTHLYRLMSTKFSENRVS